jgi:hypothetical protein
VGAVERGLEEEGLRVVVVLDEVCRKLADPRCEWSIQEHRHKYRQTDTQTYRPVGWRYSS